GGASEERWLHRFYKSGHIRGEWFHFHPSMLTVTVPEIDPVTECAALRSYLTNNRVTLADFGKAVSASAEAVRLWLTYQRRPSPKFMTAISRVTNGAVQPNDFYEAA